MRVGARLRDRFDGTGRFTAAAVVLLLLAVVSLLVALRSPAGAVYTSVTVGVPLGASAAVLAAGLTRQRRRDRRAFRRIIAGCDNFGWGLDPEAVNRYLEAQRRVERPLLR